MNELNKSNIPTIEVQGGDVKFYDFFTFLTMIFFHHLGDVSQDFSGWDFQMKNIKDVVEMGRVEEMSMADFNRRKEQIAKEIEKNL